MKLAWWKIVTIGLMLYTFFAGLFIPLKPTITNVTHNPVNDKGSYNCRVNVYNGNLKKNSKINSWLSNYRETRKSDSINVLSNQTFAATFSFYDFDNGKSFALILETDNYRDTFPNAIQVMIKNSTANNSSTSDIKNFKNKFTNPPFGFPNRPILNETVRNLFFHVPIWFAMMLTAGIGLYYGFLFLRKGEIENDMKSEKYIKTAILFGILGLLTGSLWARYTWNTWWHFDIKLNGAALTVLIYLAYLVLRSSITEEIQRAKLSAIYGIFAFALMILFVLVVPRIYDSLHPGNGGNPGFNTYDLTSSLRIVFYPAVIGWMGFAVWITNLNIRFHQLKSKHEESI